MRLRLLSIICLFTIISGNVYSQANKMTLSFEEALNMSYKNNSIFRQNELLKKEKTENRKAALGLYMPQVSLSANFVHMQKDIRLDLTPVRDAITPLYDVLGNYGKFSGINGMLINPATGKPSPNPNPGVNHGTINWSDSEISNVMQKKLKLGKEAVMAGEWNQVIQDKTFGMLSANLMWPLYAGGKIRAANKVAQLRQSEAEIQSEQKTYKHINELVERYYGLCLTYQVKTVRAEVYEAMKNHLNDAEKMYKSGLIAKVQYLHARVFYDDADRELKKADRQLQVVKKGLLNTLGVEDMDVVPVSKLFYTRDLQDLQYYKNSASENSPILKLVDNKKSMATEKFKVERADLLPSIAAIGTYDIANKDLSHFMPEYMIGVGLKWNIFGGQRSYRKTKAARLTIDRVSEIKDKYTSDINTGINKYYETLQMYIEQLEALESSMSFATEYYEVRHKSFKEGMATSTELVDAKLAVTKVKIERLKILYEFDVCLSKLLELSGLSNDFIAIQKGEKTINEEYKN